MIPVARTAWMHQGKWGLFLHFLAGPAGSGVGAELGAEEWNRRVDAFDVDGLAAQAERLGAAWIGLTIGQNSGHYCAPNPAYDRLTGLSPSRCSRRDLIADLHAALAPRGIRLIAYLPSGAPEHHAPAVAALEWRKAARCEAFQRRWEEVIRTWSLRWGARVDGWWFDGCYWMDLMYRHSEGPNFASFAAAARAGNPAAALAWNNGVTLVPARCDGEEDYTSAEVNEPDLVDAPGRTASGAQVQILTYLGQTWGIGPARFDPARAAAITRAITDHGGAVTWDVPITAHGLIDAQALPTLAAVGAAVNPTRGQPDRPAAPVPAVQLRFLRVPEPGRPGLARLELANRQERPIAGQVRLAAEPADAARIEGATTLEYRLEPGATSTSELTVAVAGDAARGGQLVVERLADGRRIPFALPVRQRLQLARLAPTSTAALPAALAALPPRTLHTAAGRSLAELRLARCGDHLAVLCHAFDPEPVRTRGLWDGSCVELFAAVPGGPVRQLLLAPPAAGAAEPAAVLVRPAEHHREPVLVAAAGLELAADTVPGGWRLAALVPLAWWLGLDAAPQDFLLDVIVGGGGRAALSGDLAASQRSDAYAVVE